LRADDPWGDVVAADLDLHRALVDGVGSGRLSRIYASICDEVRLSIVQLRPAYGSPEELAGEHRELLDAISSGPVAPAVAAMRKHLDAALDVLTQAADAELADAS
jgi:DNA-binding FadR family transcriptional regulator